MKGFTRRSKARTEELDAEVKKHYSGNCVYVLVNYHLTHAKIGYTTDVIKRHQTASTFTIWPVSYLAVVPGERKDESQTHKCWRRLKCYREWFRLDLDLLDAAKIASMQMGDATISLMMRDLSDYPAFHLSPLDNFTQDDDCYPSTLWRRKHGLESTDCDSSLVINNEFRHYVHFKTVEDHTNAFPGVAFKMRRIGRLMSLFHEHGGVVFGSSCVARTGEIGTDRVFNVRSNEAMELQP